MSDDTEVKAEMKDTQPRPEEDTVRARLRDIGARADAAVDGPWFRDDVEGRLRVYPFALIADSYTADPDGRFELWESPRSYAVEQMILDVELESWDEGEDEQDDQIRANAAFIAAARADVPSLLAALTAVLNLCDKEDADVARLHKQAIFAHSDVPVAAIRQAVSAALGGQA